MTAAPFEAARSVPIAEVIGRYVPLRRSGANYSARCPFHDDSTPSLVVYNDSDRFHCFGCGVHGDAVEFVSRMEGCDPLSAAEAVLGCSHFSPQAPVPKVSKRTSSTIEFARDIWRKAGSIDGTVADDYLWNRGIFRHNLPRRPPLRFDRLRSSKTGSIHPTLVSRIDDENGTFAGVQRTFLTVEGLRHPTAGKMTLGNLSGNATRLNSGGNKIVLTEGLEDGLSLQSYLTDASVWVTAGTSNLGKVRLPSECCLVTIAADNDDAGAKAAEAAAQTYLNQGFNVSVIHPDRQFKDFNEQLQKVGHL